MNSLVGSYLISGDHNVWSHDSADHFTDNHYPLTNVTAVFAKNDNSTIYVKIPFSNYTFENDLEYKADMSSGNYYYFSQYTVNSNNNTDECEVLLYKNNIDSISITITSESSHGITGSAYYLAGRRVN